MFFFSNRQGLKGTFRNVEDKINPVPDQSVHIQTDRLSEGLSRKLLKSLYLFLSFSEPIL